MGSKNHGRYTQLPAKSRLIDNRREFPQVMSLLSAYPFIAIINLCEIPPNLVFLWNIIYGSLLRAMSWIEARMCFIKHSHVWVTHIIILILRYKQEIFLKGKFFFQFGPFGDVKTASNWIYRERWKHWIINFLKKRSSKK